MSERPWSKTKVTTPILNLQQLWDRIDCGLKSVHKKLSLCVLEVMETNVTKSGDMSEEKMSVQLKV